MRKTRTLACLCVGGGTEPSPTTLGHEQIFLLVVDVLDREVAVAKLSWIPELRQVGREMCWELFPQSLNARARSRRACGWTTADHSSSRVCRLISVNDIGVLDRIEAIHRSQKDRFFNPRL